MIRQRQDRVPSVGMGMLLVLFALLPVAAAYSATIGTKFPIATTAVREQSTSAAFDGTNFLVGIQGDATDANSITAQLVSQSGALVGSRIRIAIGRTRDAPSVAFDGTNYLMVWVDPNNVLVGQFISTTGTLVGSAFQIGPVGLDTDDGGFAYGGGTYLFVYFKRVQVDAANSYYKVYGRTVSPSGTVGSEIPISTGFGSHALQNVAFDGSNFLVVWTDDVNDSTVMGRFVSPSGTPGTEFTVNASPAPSDDLVSVAFGGTHYLVVWADEVGGLGSGEWTLFGQRVDTLGTLVGGPITISDAPGPQVAPLIAFDGTNFLITWTDGRNDTNKNFVCDSGEGTCLDIYGRFISATGTPTGAEFPINTDSGNQFLSPAVFGGGKYLVVWTSGDTRQGTIGDVYGALIANEGTAGGTSIAPTTPLPPPPIAQTVYTAPSGRMPETAVEVSATGTFGNASLSVTLDIVQVLQAAPATGFAASTYNVYVIALVPGAVLGSASPVFFIKARAGWGALQFPVAPYLENVAQGAANNRVLIEILSNNDISSLVGTEIYIGYGESDQEMLTSGRYRGIYRAQ